MFRSASALGRLVQYYTYNTRTPLRPCMQCKSVGPLLSDTSLSRFRSTQPHVATTHHPRLISTERERQRERAQNPPLQRETWRENTGMKDSFFLSNMTRKLNKQRKQTERQKQTLLVMSEIFNHIRWIAGCAGSFWKSDSSVMCRTPFGASGPPAPVVVSPPFKIHLESPGFPL